MEQIWTIGGIIDRSRQYLAKNGVESPRLDAEILLCHILGKERIQLYVQFDQPLQKAELDAYRDFIVRRGKGEPVAHIVGRRAFLRMELVVNENVLVPRPETELLAEATVKLCRRFSESRILDIGTGSGALALGILSGVLSANAVAVDISETALAVAKLNAEKNHLAERVTFISSDIYNGLSGEKFHIIVSNPPYIPTGELAGLSREVRHEPVLALDGGRDGLDYYRRIIGGAGEHLLPDGCVAVEVGAGQAPAVVGLAKENGFCEIKILKDYAGIERIVLMTEEGIFGAD